MMIYELEEVMRLAVHDSIIPCAFCGYEPLEPDFETCPDCGERNILKTTGMI